MSGYDAAAAIFAGGAATRYGGRQKALIEVAGETILSRQLRVVRPLVREIVVVAGAKNSSELEGRGARVIMDRWPGAGPLAGLDAALAAIRAPRVLALACDMPAVQPAVVESLLSRAKTAEADVVIPEVGGRLQPLLAVYSARVAPLAETRLAAGELRMVALPDAARRAGLTVVRIGERELARADPDLRSFANLNSPPN